MLYVGLRKIAKRMGVTVWTIQRMADKLWFPLFIHPKSKLRQKHIVWAADEESIQRWILANSRLDVLSYRTQRVAQHKGMIARGVPWSDPATDLQAPTEPTANVPDKEPDGT